MPLLLDTDYQELQDQGVSYVEEEEQRFFVVPNFKLLEGLYNEDSCDVIVIIPKNYNQGGNDMFWTHPHLTRADGKAIPRMNGPGGQDNRTYEGREFCRWSRHWHQGPAVWKPGLDNISTILRRVTWALGNPDAK